MSAPEASSSQPTAPVTGNVILDQEQRYASLEVDWKGRHIKIEINYADQDFTLNKALKDFVKTFNKMNEMNFPERLKTYSPLENVTVYFDVVETPVYPYAAKAAAAAEPDDTESDSIGSVASTEDLSSSNDEIEGTKKRVGFKQDELKFTRDNQALEIKGTVATRGLRNPSKLQAVRPGTLAAQLTDDNLTQAFNRLQQEAIEELRAKGILRPGPASIVMTMKILNLRSEYYSRTDLSNLFQDLKLKLEQEGNEAKDNPDAIAKAQEFLGGFIKAAVTIKHNPHAGPNKEYKITYKFLDDGVLDQMIQKMLKR